MKSTFYLFLFLILLTKHSMSNTDTVLLTKLDSISKVQDKVSFLLSYSQEQASINLAASENSLQVADSIIIANNLIAELMSIFVKSLMPFK